MAEINAKNMQQLDIGFADNKPAYSSIFLEPTWVFQKYFGWNVIVEREIFKVFVKNLGPIKRYLILSKLSHDELCNELDKLNIFTMLSMVTIKDFTITNEESIAEVKYNQIVFLKVNESERLLNKYTFVVNLHNANETLWSNLYPDNKRVCKKAIASGMVLESTTSPEDLLLTLFFARYQKMADERSLLIPSEKLIRTMFEDGRLTMYYARIGNEICTMILVYSAALISFFFHGVAGDQRNDGSAQFVHWKVIEHLKQSGQHWYDLGGVPEISDSNGIFRFKRSLGGEGFDLGPEYYFCPAILSFAKRGYKKLRSIL